jgi:hypothetical protein
MPCICFSGESRHIYNPSPFSCPGRRWSLFFRSKGLLVIFSSLRFSYARYLMISCGLIPRVSSSVSVNCCIMLNSAGKDRALGRLLNKNRNLVSKAIFRTSRPFSLRAPLLFPSRLPVQIPWTFLMLTALYPKIGYRGANLQDL